MITQSMLNAQVEAENNAYRARCEQTYRDLPALLKREYKRGYAAGRRAALKDAKKTKVKP